MKNTKWVIAVFAGLALAGCAMQQNPAIVYCEDVGGEYTVKQNIGYCELPGRTVEASELYQAKGRFNKP